MIQNISVNSLNYINLKNKTKNSVAFKSGAAAASPSQYSAFGPQYPQRTILPILDTISEENTVSPEVRAVMDKILAGVNLDAERNRESLMQAMQNFKDMRDGKPLTYNQDEISADILSTLSKTDRERIENFVNEFKKLDPSEQAELIKELHKTTLEMTADSKETSEIAFTGSIKNAVRTAAIIAAIVLGTIAVASTLSDPNNLTAINSTLNSTAATTTGTEQHVGFESIFAVSGLMAVAYLVLGRRE